MSTSLIYIIIPTYNEAENLSKLVEHIFSLPLNIKVLVVDDNSPDKTGNIADQLSLKYNLEVLHRPGKMGLGSAYIAGFKKAFNQKAEYIMEMDADFSHNPSDIVRLFAGIELGYDLVIGSRRVKGGGIVGWGMWRNIMSWGAMFFSRIMLNLKTKDVTAGFRCYRRSFLERLPLEKIKSNGYSFQEEMLFLVEKFGGKVLEVPVIFNDRQLGKSKMNFKDIWYFFIIIFQLKFRYAQKYYRQLE